jgi:hypothetical protein
MTCTLMPLLLQEEIYSSSYAAAAYLESINFNKKVSGLTNTVCLAAWMTQAGLDRPALTSVTPSSCVLVPARPGATPHQGHEGLQQSELA